MRLRWDASAFQCADLERKRAVEEGFLRLTSECLTCRHEFLLLHGIDLRVIESEALHRFYNSRGDDESCEPFVIGGDHVPRRMLRRSGPDRFLKCVHVIVPVVTLLHT